MVYAGGLAALCFTLYGTVIYSFRNGEAMGILPYEYPNIVLFSVAVMVFAKGFLSKCQGIKTYSLFITMLSKCTFGIYLLHLLLLKLLYRFGINMTICHPILSIPLIALIVFVIGFAATWLLKKVPLFGNYFV